MSIRLRLTVWYSGILAATLLIFGIGLYFFLHFYYYNGIRDDLQQRGENTYEKILPIIGFAESFGLDNVLDDSTLLGGQLAQVRFADGNVSKSYALNRLKATIPLSEQAKKALQKNDALFEKGELLKQPIYIYNRSIVLASGKNGVTYVGVLQVALPISGYDRFFDMLQYILAFLAFVTIFVASTIGLFLARKALAPIDHVIDAANQIQIGADLGRRIPYDGPYDEVGRLTHTYNGMLDRIQTMYTELDEAYRAQRRFVSDASHELRTPLTTIRGNVDLLEKMWRRTAENLEHADKEQLQLSLEAMQDIAGEAQRMSRLVSDLLSLARADAGVQFEKDDIELLPLVEEVARRAQFLERKAEWRIGSLEALNGAVVCGSRDYLQQLLFIFIENAFKYTPSGYVELDALRSGSQVGLRIKDTGIGMDKEEIPHIFERFYRADESRGKTAGTGLGLSIAKWIIDEHGGSIEVVTRKDEGSTFVVWLPATFPQLLE
jgi:signal transduction histidine kinase